MSTSGNLADYRRNFTCYLLDMESRIHTNRQATKENLDDVELWQMRRHLAEQVCGSDVLLASQPTENAVRIWRDRFVPKTDVVDETLPERLALLRTAFERLAMERSKHVEQFPQRKKRNLAKFHRRNTVSIDGTHAREWSGVSIRNVNGETKYHGTRSRTFVKQQAAGPAPDDTTDKTFTMVRNARVQRRRSPHKDHASKGVNHVAVLTGTRYGRIILTLERALGGETHAAVRGLDRILPLADGAIQALTYDKAWSGWPRDYVLARHGVVSVAMLTAEEKVHPEELDADRVAADLLRARSITQAAPADAPADQGTEGSGTPSDGKKSGKKRGKKKAVPGWVKHAVAQKVLGQKFDIQRLADELEDGRAIGSGLALGTCVYLDSRGGVVPVASQTRRYDTVRHRVGAEWCVHELHLDDGAVWDTRLERGLVVKDQRLVCVEGQAERDDRTGWHVLTSTYQFTCEYTGEILTKSERFAPNGDWGGTKKARTAVQEMQILARCDPGWRNIYGLRQDTESWFSWLKQQFLEHQRTTSRHPRSSPGRSSRTSQLLWSSSRPSWQLWRRRLQVARSTEAYWRRVELSRVNYIEVIPMFIPTVLPTPRPRSSAG